MLCRTVETVVCPRFTKNLAKLLLMILPACAQAASFDCAKPATQVEHLICADPELSKLDEEMTEAYTAILQDQAKAKAAMAMQRMWLEVRNDCNDPACLKTAYQARLRELHPAAEEAAAIALQISDAQRAEQGGPVASAEATFNATSGNRESTPSPH